MTEKQARRLAALPPAEQKRLVAAMTRKVMDGMARTLAERPHG